MPTEKPVLCGVGVIVFNEKGEFLMMKRTSKHATGTYSLPGGWMEFGEAIEEVGAREVKEELGVEIENIKVIGVSNNFFPTENLHTVSALMAAKLVSGQEPKNMEPHKCEALIWQKDWDNLPQPAFTKYNQYVTSEDLKRYLEK